MALSVRVACALAAIIHVSLTVNGLKYIPELFYLLGGALRATRRATNCLGSSSEQPQFKKAAPMLRCVYTTTRNSFPAHASISLFAARRLLIARFEILRSSNREPKPALRSGTALARFVGLCRSVGPELVQERVPS